MLKANGEEAGDHRVDLGVIGREQVSAPLQFGVNGSLVLSGQLESEEEAEVHVSRMIINLDHY